MRITRRVSTGLGAVALILMGQPQPSARAADGDGTPWLGVYSQSLSSELREGLQYNGPGVLVSGVVPDSPADRAGIQKGDVVTKVGTREVNSPEALMEAVEAGRVGQTVAVQMFRDGKRQTLYAKLGERSESAPEVQDREPADVPDAPEAPEAPEAPKGFSYHGDDDDFTIEVPEGGFSMMGMGRGRLGVRIESLNPDLAKYFGVTSGKGVLVVEVIEDSPASRAGLKAGDVITNVGDRTIDDSDDLVRAINNSDENVKITVIRQRAKQTIDAKLNASPRVLRLRRGDSMMRHPAPRMNWYQYDSGQRDSLQRELKQLRDEMKELQKEMEKLKR